MKPSEPDSDRWSFSSPGTAALVVMLLAGGVLRCWGLAGQILADDEWHAVRSAVGESYWQLFTGFSVSAAPTLSLLYKLLHDTVGLSELLLRIPLLLAGLASIVLFPLILPAVRAGAGDYLFGHRTRAIFAALVAVSPLLVYFSRYARPYAVSLLLTFVGVWALWRWYHHEAGRFGALWIACAVLGPAFHLTAASSLLAPLPLLWAHALWRRFGGAGPGIPGRSAWEVVRVAVFAGIGLVALVGAPMVFDFAALSSRAGASQTDWLTLRESLPLLAGGESPVLWLMLAAAAVGGFAVVRAAPALAVYLGWVSLATAAGTWISGADSVQVPIVFLRYSLWLAPMFLLLAALGFAQISGWIRRPLPAGAALATLVGALYLGGPLPGVLHHLNNWPHHAIFQYSYRSGSPFSYERRPPTVPVFYQQLAKQPPGSVVLAEAPFYYEWHNNVLPYYQETHQQHVVAGLLGDLCQDPQAITALPPLATRLELRNAVDLDNFGELVARDVTFVVLHLEPRAELPAFNKLGSRVPATNLRNPSRLARCLPRFVGFFGPAVFQDGSIAVFTVPDQPVEVGDLPPLPTERAEPPVQLDAAQLEEWRRRRHAEMVPLMSDGFESGNLRGWSGNQDQ